MATIYITDLRLRCIIGANDWERDHKQDVVINIDIEFDATKSSESDDLKDTLDYKTVTKKIIEEVEASQFFLLEKLVSKVLDIICEHPLVEEARVKIDKPGALRFADSVSIELTRSK